MRKLQQRFVTQLTLLCQSKYLDTGELKIICEVILDSYDVFIYICEILLIFKKYKTFSVLIYSYINTSGNWKNEKLCGNTTPAGRSVFTQFRVFPIFTRGKPEYPEKNPRSAGEINYANSTHVQYHTRLSFSGERHNTLVCKPDKDFVPTYANFKFNFLTKCYLFL